MNIAIIAQNRKKLSRLQLKRYALQHLGISLIMIINILYLHHAFFPPLNRR